MANRVTLEENEEYIKQVIKRIRPDIELSKTSPNYELFVQFHNNTLVKDILEKEIDIENNRSLLNTSMDATEYDGLLANTFTNRSLGSTTKINIKVVFNSIQNVTIKTTDLFRANLVDFLPDRSYIIEAINYTQLDTEEFSFDISLNSVNIGSDTVVGEDISVITPFNNEEFFVRAYVTQINEFGTNSQTNEEAFEKAKNEFSVRNNINRKSIKAVLSENFNTVVSNLYVAGYQQPEMFRDIVSLEVPKRYARLYFQNKQDLIIQKGTLLQYNQDPNIKYSTLNLISISQSSLDWKTTPLGKNYIETEIETESISNPLGFTEDVPFTIPSLSTNSNFLGSHARTKSDSTTTIHRGTMADIYVKTNTVREKIKLNVPITGSGLIDFPSQYKPVLKVHKVEKINSENILEYEPFFFMSVASSDIEKRFTKEDNMKLFVNPSLIGQSIYVDITYSPYISQIDNKINDVEEEMIDSSQYVKHMIPMFVQIFGVINGSTTAKDAAISNLTSYINSLRSSTLDKTSIISVIKNTPGINYIDVNSLQIKVQEVLPDGSIIDLDDSDLITPHEDLTQGVSIRNTCYFTEAIDFVLI